MAACQGTRSLPSVSLTPALASEHSNRSKSWLCTHVGLPSRFKSQGVRHLFGIKDEPLCRKSVETRARLGGDGDVDLNGEAIAEDFYSVLGLTPDATQEEIKKAYYSCMKACHPDLSGNSPDSTDFCMLVNEIYEVLSDPDQRMVYDEINGYTLTFVNPFLNPKQERDHTFVDEFSCIGCKNCGNVAPGTFEIEEEYGRARVRCQSGNPRLTQEAIETCPVDCIHWVTAAQLTLLEDEMRRIERVNVGMMLAGMGSQSPDVFAQASWRWEKRQAKALERARIRMMKENGKDAPGAWWQGWTNPGGDGDFKPDDMGARERAAKTAAASRRWREYSRQNAGRRSVYSLPPKSGARDESESEVAVK
ncbi:uncharacterized protein [Physcomitrium patens]|uniref:J domain-containing protein n=2 Tax=Physcomitrium patens TaxID=3218 RepID=A0A2K1IF55_PHYPA|nr:chaperone protein dnaJ C76, chloroplastic-like isoform X1 [Physcomitrium patens]XP_024364481.1 chaperone protein dnaJ C76, chloroplastic-like isoform X1 [Physcomitrium patens]XP_024364482.1 chaperone protein dnaJ C76, chloroplastic-like isoform X1 [Physcomitrium patens]PNR27907.1 hypothetical protein PHYPA_028499 [Physcomitrium patens]|eukprot:XP_024364480.1 chaperone protein dnaJ C76, chloroplastic-like isoform X1 [Physcomitrella patens]